MKIKVFPSIDAFRQWHNSLGVYIQNRPNDEHIDANALLSYLKSQDFSLEYKDVISFFRYLAGEGYGEVIVGRRGKSTRFRYSKKLPSQEDAIKPSTHQNVSQLKHSFNLRPDFIAIFELPLNLTTSEAARLSRFIEALPMEDAGKAGQ
ncbi:MAG: hypothetical protein ABSH19_04380 [Opitutales bacterium]|jgi:hypothetical protein